MRNVIEKPTADRSAGITNRSGDMASERHQVETADYSKRRCWMILEVTKRGKRGNRSRDGNGQNVKSNIAGRFGSKDEDG